MYFCKQILFIAICLGIAQQYNGFQTRQKLKYPFRVFEGPFGRLQCIKECLRRTACTVMGYRQKFLRCELASMPDIVADDDPESITESRSNMTQYQNLLRQCANHDCSERKICIEYGSNFSCVVDACPPSWKMYRNHCYYFTNLPLNWTDASSNCKSLGGYLTRINDGAENHWLSHINVPLKQVWLGARKLPMEEWRWERDGSPVELDLWYSTDRLNDEGCMFAFYDETWLPTACSSIKSPSCEITKYGG